MDSAEIAKMRSDYDDDGTELGTLVGELGNYYSKLKTQFTPAFFTRIKQSKVYTEIIAETEV